MMVKLLQKSKCLKNCPRISKIRENQYENLIFDFPKATVGDINEVIKDGIPVKMIKTGRNVINSDLTNIIKKDLNNYKFSGNAKPAFVRALYKKNNRRKFKGIDV